MSEPQHQFKGVWIPREVWLNPGLTWMEKCLAAEIDALDDGAGCYASNAYLASVFKSTEASIANQISKLRSLGFVKTVSFDGKQRRLKATWAYPVELTTQLTQPQPHSEPCINRAVKDRDYLVSNREDLFADVDGNPAEPKPQSRFDEFYSAYPKKKSRGHAEKAWRARQCDKNADAVIAALHAQIKAGMFKKEAQYIAHPATWLNGKRWEDEIVYENNGSTRPGNNRASIHLRQGIYKGVGSVGVREDFHGELGA